MDLGADGTLETEVLGFRQLGTGEERRERRLTGPFRAASEWHVARNERKEIDRLFSGSIQMG
jgi:hypothetical protein